MVIQRALRKESWRKKKGSAGNYHTAGELQEEQAWWKP